MVVVPLAGILVDVGSTPIDVPAGDGDAVVCGLIALLFVVDGDVVDGDVVPGIAAERVVPFCLTVDEGVVTVFELPFSVPFAVPLLKVPLGLAPLFIVPFVVVGLVVAGLVVVGVVVPGTLAGFVCADAIPIANNAAPVKISFFILLFFCGSFL